MSATLDPSSTAAVIEALRGARSNATDSGVGVDEPTPEPAR